MAAREALPEVRGQGFFQILDRVLETGEPLRFEARTPTPPRWFDVRAWRLGSGDRTQVAVTLPGLVVSGRTEEEMAQVRRHPAHTQQILGRVPRWFHRPDRRAGGPGQRRLEADLEAGLEAGGTGSVG